MYRGKHVDTNNFLLPHDNSRTREIMKNKGRQPNKSDIQNTSVPTNILFLEENHNQ